VPDTFLLRASAALIQALGALAPEWRRADWRAEWLAELHFRASRLAAHGRLTRLAELRLATRSAGAAIHVLWLWKHEWGLDMLTQDLRYGVRLLGRRPAFSIVAIVTLALGIGATTAIFSAVRAVLLRPLPYPEPSSVVRLYGVDRRSGQQSVGNLSVPDVRDFERAAGSLAAIGAHNYGGYFTLTGIGEPERVPRLLVTAGYFRVLDARPAIGRLFRPDEDRPDPPSVVVVSYGFWQRRFGGDPGIIGKGITLSGGPATIVGVLRPDFVHPDPKIESAPDVFALLDPDENMSSRGGRYVRGLARLKAGVTIEQAGSELDAVAAELARQYPPSNTGRSVLVRPLALAVAGDFRLPLLLLQAATGTILLIACVNLANLLLGASAGRSGELAVRTALGAGRRRLVRQLLTESVLLAGLGGLVGTALAAWATRSLASMAGPMLLPGQSIPLDTGVLVFAIGLSLAAGLTFGLLPALFISRDTAAGALREGRRQTAAPLGTRLRSSLIVAEVALSVTLLVGAVLLLRSFQHLVRVDPGFQTADVLSFQLAVQTTEYPEGTQAGFYERLYARLGTLPGIASVGGVNILPFSGNYSCDGVQVEGRLVPEAQAPCAEARSASPGYFEVMRIPVVRGRVFTPADTAAASRVIVVNEAFARRFFPGEDPIGRRVIYTSRRQNDPRTIVGIIGDVHHFGLDAAAPAEFYTPEPQPPSYHGMTVVLRVQGDPAAVLPAVRAGVRALAPDAPLYNVRTLDELVDASVSAARFRTVLLALFAGLALVLAVVGTYGVMSLAVSERRQEMGIRLALGAARSDILRLVLSGGLQPLAAGAALGLAGGVLLSHGVTGLLFNITAADPATFAIAAAVILVAGLAAAWLPAHRACRVDPAIALRQ
jgi:putative ABC transport system permease protein